MLFLFRSPPLRSIVPSVLRYHSRFATFRSPYSTATTTMETDTSKYKLNRMPGLHVATAAAAAAAAVAAVQLFSH
ncbi:hypothetical protein AJ79_05110 [Helicocarpus griseus UAMH5409]|uniref:Uncharacterized protein n=1 Tax=Helicocarpus griseus UAMH5409 TaxID=1447875 RepID=A0A2B7XR30_9EURO|nr:hypothetical protein AJ79_05110 [Helicocarpus griseus UAMH5409]